MTQKDAFEESFKLVGMAEDLGVDSVWLAEYHFNVDRSVLSAPITVASAIAARTERMRIGLAVHILPPGQPGAHRGGGCHPGPHQPGPAGIRHRARHLPQCSRGVRSTLPREPRQVRRFLEIIIKAWTNDSFSFEGEHYQCSDVAVAPHPYQEPYPPITVGITSVDSFPIIGSMGFPILINPSRVSPSPNWSRTSGNTGKHGKQAGHSGEPQVGLRVPFYVAGDRGEGLLRAKGKRRQQHSTPWGKGYRLSGLQGTTGDWGAGRTAHPGHGIRGLASGQGSVRNADAAVEKINRLKETLGLSRMMFEINFGSHIPFEHQAKSLELITREVLPPLPVTGSLPG